MTERALLYGFGVTGQAVADALLARGYQVVVADDAQRRRPGRGRPARRRAGRRARRRAPRRAGQGGRRGRSQPWVAGDATRCSISPWRPTCRSAASSTSPPSGTTGLCWPSPAPTARRRSRRSPPRCSTPPGCGPPPSGTPRCRSSPRSATPRSTCSWSRHHRSGSTTASASPRWSATWLNFGVDHLDWHASLGGLRAGEGADLGAPGPDRVGDRQRRRPGRARPPADRAGAARDLRASPRWPTTGSTATSCGRLTASSLPAPMSCGAPCPTTSPTRSRRPRLPDLGRRPSTARVPRCSGSAGCPTASSSSARPTASAGTTTRRRPPPMPPLAALRAFEHIVLIAGGRNKGLDLCGLAGAEPTTCVPSWPSARRPTRSPPRSRRAPGARSPPRCATRSTRRRSFAEPGDAVLLSPACATFDWYPSLPRAGRRLRPAAALEHIGAAR